MPKNNTSLVTILIIAFFALTSLFLNSLTVLGVVSGSIYIIVVLGRYWFISRSFPLKLAIISILLIITGYSFSADENQQWLVVLNKYYAGIAMWASVFSVFWTWQEKMQQRCLEEKLTNVISHKTYLIFLGFTAIIITASWSVWSRIEVDVKHDIQRSLTATLTSSKSSLHGFIENEKNIITLWSENKQIYHYVNDLILLSDSPDSLLLDTIHLKLRQLLTPILSTIEHSGYYIISNKNENLSSFEDSNIGSKNLLLSQGPFLNKVRAGEKLVSFPIRSDVELLDHTGKPVKDLMVMFVAAPIKNEQGETIAIIAFRFDPDISMLPIYKQGHIGQSGETYAFNKQGIMLNESRFHEQLLKAGLFKSNKHIDFAIKIVDPGFDLTSSQRVAPNQNNLPLTLMAQSALAKKSGSNLNGYRNYLGVLVVGSWVWDEKYQIGITTEIGAEEAFKTLNNTHNNILIFSFFAILVLFIMTIVFINFRYKVSLNAKKYQNSIDLTSEGYLAVNAQGLIKEVNKAFCQMIGRTNEELLGQNPLTFAQKQSDELSDANSFYAELTGTPRYEVTFINKQNEFIYTSINATKVTNSDGETTGGFAFISNISEAKKASNLLDIYIKELDFQKYALDEHAIVSITDVNGKITYVNDKLCEISGYSRHELMGKNHRMLKSGEHSTDFYNDLWRTITDGKTWHGELKSLKKDGSYFWANATIVPTLNKHGVPFQYIAIRTDSTKVKDAEIEAENANKAKSQFLANMSHEIRTPLGAIIGMAGLCLDTQLNNKQYKYLHNIDDSAKSLLTIINDILDYSKIESGKLTIEKRAFSFNELLIQLSSLINYKAFLKSIDILFDVNINMATLYLGDIHRIRQILLNLIDNATKFTTEGEIILKIMPVVDENKETSKILFSVSDTGIGMDQKTISKLFSVYTQADSSTTRKYGGSGLGLSICKNLVSLMGGEIQVTSTIGKGTIVNFTIDCKVDENKVDERYLITNDNIAIFTYNPSLKLALTNTLVANKSNVYNVESIDELSQIPPNIHNIMIDGLLPESEIIKAFNIIHSLTPQALRIFLLSNEYEKPSSLSHLHFKLLKRSMVIQSLFDAMNIGKQKETRYQQRAVDDEHLAPLAGLDMIVAEDNEMNQEIISELLKKVGINVHLAKNGKEAIDLLEQRKVDGIIMDLQMPVMGGIDATTHIKQQSKWENLPIIALTASTMKGDKELGLSLGFFDYLTKPIDPSKLYDSLSKYFTPLKTSMEPKKRKANTPSIKKVSSLNTKAIFDIDAGLTVCAGKMDLFERITKKFAEKSTTELEKLKQHCRDGNIENCTALLHNLKGLSANIGALQLSFVTNEIEQDILFNNNVLSDEQLKKIHDEVLQVVNAISSYFD